MAHKYLLNPEWPVLTNYDQEHSKRIALPLGGIGTGTISLGGRGQLQDWEVGNRPAKGFIPGYAFFALYAKPDKGQAVSRALEGAFGPPYEGANGGCPVANHGLPRFRNNSFHAAYPFGQVLLSDPEVPVNVRIEAFNPLIPADAESSGIPVAVLRFVLQNKTGNAVRAAICGNFENFIGTDGSNGKPSKNANEFRKSRYIKGIFLSSKGISPDDEFYGTIALSTDASDVSWRTAWAEADLSWGDTLLDFWDDFSSAGRLTERKSDGMDAPMASLAAGITLPRRGERQVTFLLTWHFPNRKSWDSGTSHRPVCVGNYYTTQYKDAWNVAERVALDLPRLEAATRQFVLAFCANDLPRVVKEAGLYNLSTLRTQTAFRIASGHLLGWEGCGDNCGCCHGTCTHVWNYENATAFLFGNLSRTMREIEFRYATHANGFMSFRVELPLRRAQDFVNAAADGQMGCLVKLYRDWQLSGDDNFLRQLWPKARKALEFCWIAGGWDANKDGVMEGCQHNTMDVEYFGPNPQMTGWYLAALRAAEEMARYLGENDFAQTCRGLFERGSRWIDKNLFNGDYYEHQIRPPASAAEIAPGLRRGLGTKNLKHPASQLGAGCLVDQLVGQYMAHTCALGYLLDKNHVRKTLQSIMKYNFRKNLYGHFNHYRSFAVNDESALLMASYPKGRRPQRPFPYYNEVMTGFEYTAAAHMLYEGQIKNGLKCIAAVRARYDGLRRNPFDEAECGHHYARAMASWTAILALTGFHYSAVDQTMSFKAANGRVKWFWSNGYAWGICEQKPTKTAIDIKLTLYKGSLSLKKFILEGYGHAKWDRAKSGAQGRTLAFRVARAGIKI